MLNADIIKDRSKNYGQRKTLNQRIFYIIFTLLAFTTVSYSSASAQFFGFKRDTYQTPFTLTVFDLKVGVESFNYASIDGVGASRSASVYTLDFAKFNFMRYIWKQSMVDILTGFSVNYVTSFGFNDLSSAFPQPTNDFKGTAALSPKVVELNINETFNYTLGTRMIIYGQISYGISNADLYRSREGSSYLKGSANPLGIGFGAQLLIRSHESSRVGLGFEFKFTDLRVKDLEDPEGIAQFTELDLSHYGATVTLGMIFGGRRSVGDDAEKLYKSGRFIDSRSKYTEFLRLHPSHPRADRARHQITEADKHIPSELYDRATDSQRDNNFEGALRLYNRIEKFNKNDFDLARKITTRKKEISQNYFEMGLKAHADWEFANSERWFLRAEFIDSSLSDAVRIAISEMLLTKSKLLIEEEKVRVAEATLIRVLEMNPTLSREVEIAYSKIARVAFLEGVEALNRNSYIYAKDSFERAGKYNREMRKKADLQIAFVEEAIAKEKISAGKIRHAEIMAQNKRHLADRLIAGVDKERVLRMWGMPSYKYYVTDGPTNYELWVYQSARNQYYYIYFTENRLHSWEIAEF